MPPMSDRLAVTLTVQELDALIERAALRAAAEALAEANAHTSETGAFTQPALMSRWGVSRKTLWRLVKSGRLTSVRVGNATLYPREVVEQIERGDLGSAPRGVPRRRVAR